MRTVYLILILAATGGVYTLVMPNNSAFSLDKAVATSDKTGRVFASNALMKGEGASTTGASATTIDGSILSSVSTPPRANTPQSKAAASGAPEAESYMLLDEQHVSTGNPKDAGNAPFWPGAGRIKEGNASAPQLTAGSGADLSAASPETPSVPSGTHAAAPSENLGNPNSLATVPTQGAFPGAGPSLSFPGGSHGGGAASHTPAAEIIPSTTETVPTPVIHTASDSVAPINPSSTPSGGGNQVPAGGGELNHGNGSPAQPIPEAIPCPLIPTPQPVANQVLEPDFPGTPNSDYPGNGSGTTPPVEVTPVPDAGSSALMLGSLLTAFVFLRRRRS